MDYSIIGTGNIAWLLATKLSGAGHTCRGIYGRSRNKALTLAKTINAPVLNSLTEIRDDMDCCIMAVSDKAIADLSGQLQFRNTALIHTAGAMETSVLSAAAQHYGVLWPVYSIVKDNLPQHRDVPVVWEASSENAANIIQRVAGSFSDNPLMLEYDKRKWLHLTAVLGNNFTNHLFAVCEKICRETDIPFSVLMPIIRQTTDRLYTASPADTQTGPARRGDKTIIDRHLQMLQQQPEWADFYKSISASIEKMYNQ